jgi:hypothetical protein
MRKDAAQCAAPRIQALYSAADKSESHMGSLQNAIGITTRAAGIRKSLMGAALTAYSDARSGPGTAAGATRGFRACCGQRVVSSPWVANSASASRSMPKATQAVSAASPDSVARPKVDEKWSR